MVVEKIDKQELIIQVNQCKVLLEDELVKHGSVCPKCKSDVKITKKKVGYTYLCSNSECKDTDGVISLLSDRLNISYDMALSLLGGQLGYDYKYVDDDNKLLIVPGDEYMKFGIGKTKEFLIEGLVYENSVGFIIAPPKVGKTTFTFLLSRALATGEDFLGHKVNGKRNVLYVLSEGTLNNTIKHFGSPSNLQILEHNQFDWCEQRELVINHIIEHETDMVVLDSLYKVVDIDITKSVQLKPFLKELEKLSSELSCTFIMPHHTNRLELTDNHQNKVSGSADIVRSGEFFIFLDKPKIEEEHDNLLLTEEELNEKPMEIIMTKHDYRYGRTGFNKYAINIDFANATVTGDRYKLGSKRADKTDRLEDLINYATFIVADMEGYITKSKLTDKLTEHYKSIGKVAIQKNYIQSIFDYLVSNKVIRKATGYNFEYIGEAKVVDLTQKQIAITEE
ncbi:MAG: AAA family ATPase [Paraclostridium sp.]